MVNTDHSAVLVYMPVVHRGYIDFLHKYPHSQIFLFGPSLVAEFHHLRKDVRALDQLDAVQVLKSLFPQRKIEVVESQDLTHKLSGFGQVIVPDEDIMRELVAKYLTGAEVRYESTFLRWDKQNSLKKHKVNPDQVISKQKFDQEMMSLASELADKSSDWWRQIGAVLVKNGQVVLSGYNHHVPHELKPYFDGDPRGNFHKGEYIKISTAIHTEAFLIAQAAQKGISLDGASLYVTTFPCPVCAKQVAYSGVKKIYFADGYSMLDGESVMKDNGVEIIQVSVS